MCNKECNHFNNVHDRPQVPLSLRLGPLTALRVGGGLAPRLGLTL